MPGFESPNYTQAPNDFFDIALKNIDNLAELKVVAHIIRKTLGWKKKSDNISISQMITALNLSRHSVIDGAHRAVEHGWITKTLSGTRKTARYQLNVTPPLVQSLHYPPVQSLHPQKKEDLKENTKILKPPVIEENQGLAPVGDRSSLQRPPPPNSGPPPPISTADSNRDGLNRLMTAYEKASPILCRNRSIFFAARDEFEAAVKRGTSVAVLFKTVEGAVELRPWQIVRAADKGPSNKQTPQNEQRYVILKNGEIRSLTG